MAPSHFLERNEITTRDFNTMAAGLRVMFVCRQQFKLTLPGKCAQTLDFFGRLVIFTFLTNELQMTNNSDFT